MKIHVFKTNIQSILHIYQLKPVLAQIQTIIRWTVDLQDVDNVLKIVTHDQSSEDDFIRLLRREGFQCEKLPD